MSVHWVDVDDGEPLKMLSERKTAGGLNSKCITLSPPSIRCLIKFYHHERLKLYVQTQNGYISFHSKFNKFNWIFSICQAQGTERVRGNFIKQNQINHWIIHFHCVQYWIYPIHKQIGSLTIRKLHIYNTKQYKLRSNFSNQHANRFLYSTAIEFIYLEFFHHTVHHLFASHCLHYHTTVQAKKISSLNDTIQHLNVK